jgi:hypothetical protein
MKLQTFVLAAFVLPKEMGYILFWIILVFIKKSSPVRGLEWPRGFQEVKVPKFFDNNTGWW